MDNANERVSLQFQNSVTGQGKLDKYEQRLLSLKKIIETFPKSLNWDLGGNDYTKTLQKTNDLLINLNKNMSSFKRSTTSALGNIKKPIQETNKEIQNISSNLKPVNKDLEQISKTTKIAFSYTAIREFTRALSRAFKVLSSFATKSSDYLENINLFQVAFDNSYNSAERFINKLNEMYGLDESWLTRTVGIFKQLSNAMNLSAEQGTRLSTLLTQMSIDISSLYNIDIERASSTLQSALAGQTKPIRGATGGDITQNTLQQTLDELNINAQITNLSYAEKRLITIVSLTRQLSEATNDFGRTIESPANQMRILSEQWERLTRAIGNVFMPILAQVLPWLNAILMVLTEIINAVATLFGYNSEDYDYFGGVADSVLELEDSLNGASSSVEKLKQGLRSFDKLNNITTPTSGGVSVGASGGGINPDIWNAFNDAYEDYNNKLDDVQMKATKIRDAIMEWLGFTKQIDEETGDVSFKFDHITSGTVLGALAVGGIIYSGVKGIANFLKRIGLLKFVNFTGLVNAIKGLNFKNFGLAGLALSVAGAYDVLYEIGEGAKTANDSVLGLISSLGGAIASGALFGSKFGLYGTAIGAFTGLVLGLTSALTGYIDGVNNLEVNTKVFDDQGISIETLTGKYEKFFENSILWVEDLDGLKAKYDETSSSLSNAKDEVTLFQEELMRQDETISQTQLEELNVKYDNLIQKTKDATQASLDYEIGLINAYQNVSNGSTESTAEQIANLEALKLAQQGYEIDYIEQQQKLAYEYLTGQKSLSEYNKALSELDIRYGYAYDSSFDATGAIGNFNKALSEINYKNIENAGSAMSSASDIFNNSVDTLNEHKETIDTYFDNLISSQQTIIENYDKQIAKGKTLDDYEQDRYETAKGLIETYKIEHEKAIALVDNSIETISSSYKGFLAGVYADLVKDGAQTSNEFNAVITGIEEDLKKLKDFDMSGFGKEMFDSMIDSITKNEKSSLPALADRFSKYGINAGDEFANALQESLEDDNTFGNIEKSAEGLGESAPSGFRKGVDNYLGKFGAGGDEIAKVCIEGARTELDSHSPSKVFEKIGEDTVQGYINGIENSTRVVNDTIKNLLNSIQEQFNTINFEIKISTSVEKSFNSILSKLETFINKFRSGINSLLYNMTKSMNNVTVGNDNKLYYQSMPYISVPRFEKGLDFVPHDYFPAYLDYGERVLTKEENQDYMNSQFNNQNYSQNKTSFNPTFIIQVGDKEIAKMVLNDLQDMAKSNGKPITIR